MNLDDIVKLWYKTQMGHYKECQKNQLYFADIMWTLYEKLKEKAMELPDCTICDEDHEVIRKQVSIVDNNLEVIKIKEKE